MKKLTNNFDIKTVKQFNEIDSANKQNYESNVVFSDFEKHVYHIINTVLYWIINYSDIQDKVDIEYALKYYYFKIKLIACFFFIF